MAQKNLFFAHSGGVTAVVNTIAAAVIDAAEEHTQINRVYAGKNGIIGAIQEELIDVYQESATQRQWLYHTPASAFGSCRYKLDPENPALFNRILAVFKAHNIGYFLYNGGNDSQDTTHKIWQMSKQLGYPLRCIGIPKTVDNDLAHTDVCPGFGSVAKYVAISTKEASLDVASMAETSTKVFILEVMGRHAGWITAAAGLAASTPAEGPHILLFPEVAFDKTAFINRVQSCIKQYGHCVVVASEGLQDNQGNFLSQAGTKDAFGHQQLGGVAPYLAQLTTESLGVKNHWAVADYLQRSARHISAHHDVEQAKALGTAAVKAAADGKSGIMMTIDRLCDTPYQWHIGEVPLASVANVEKKLPAHFMTADKMHITDAAKRYLSPLIQGESYPPYLDNGLPCYATLRNMLVDKKLPTSEVV